METKEIKTERALSVSGVTLIPVVESGASGRGMDDVVFFTGFKRPLAIVAIIGGRKKVYRITGEEITVEQLVKEFPSVKESVEGL